jgi:hypothetical protein
MCCTVMKELEEVAEDGDERARTGDT